MEEHSERGREGIHERASSGRVSGGVLCGSGEGWTRTARCVRRKGEPKSKRRESNQTQIRNKE